MSDAVYGLAGALGGSLVTAAVAYWGPLHQQREVAKQAELQRSAELRRAEIEIEAARAQAEEARKHLRNQAEIGRLVDVRSTLRAWELVLDDAFLEMRISSTFDVDRFRETEQEAMAKGLRALDEVMHDDWYVVISYYGDPTYGPHLNLVESLKECGERIKALGLAGRLPSAEEQEELDELRDQIGHARGRMSEIIAERLDSIVT
ncbi:hypothetical protein [Streptomyces sp. NPDC056512]|uniref:hypothetical protein n=2 Tax=unclassified Streptomyces TaxID=2593676 RepID=UPI00368FB988